MKFTKERLILDAESHKLDSEIEPRREGPSGGETFGLQRNEAPRQASKALTQYTCFALSQELARGFTALFGAAAGVHARLSVLEGDKNSSAHADGWHGKQTDQTKEVYDCYTCTPTPA